MVHSATLPWALPARGSLQIILIFRLTIVFFHHMVLLRGRGVGAGGDAFDFTSYAVNHSWQHGVNCIPESGRDYLISHFSNLTV